MAKIFTDDEILELAKEKGIDLTENDVRERNTLGADNDVIDYEEQLKSLGKKEGYDYLQDFKEVKESLLANTYSPRTKKVYSYEEAQNMTAKDYYNDVMDAANHLDNDNGALKTFAWGLLERTGGSALVKGIAGEERVKDIQNQVENVYGNNGIARMLGRITGDVWALGTAGMAGSAISGAAGGSAALGSILGQTAAGGLTGGAEAYTYSNDPVDVAAGAARGSAYGLARGVVSNALKTSLMNANPEILRRATEIANPNIVTTGKDVALNVAQNFGVNALSQGAGAYAGTAASGTAGNLINAIGGKEVSAKDWTKPFWSTETLLATGLSALIGGTLETVNDRIQISNFVKKDIDAINAQAQKNAIGMEQALKNGDTASATAFAKAETDAINSYLGKTYAGASFNDSFKQQMMNDWTNYVADQFKKYGVPFDIPKQIGTGASNMNITPDFGNTPPSGGDLVPTNGALAPSTTTSGVIDSTNLGAYNVNIRDGLEGGVQNEQGNIGLGDEAEISKRLSDVEQSYKTSRKAEQLQNKMTKTLSESQNGLKKTFSRDKGIELVFYEDDGEDYVGFATRDGRIYLNDSIEDEELNFIAEHETAELMLLNNYEKASEQMAKYVSQLLNNEDGMRYYYMDKLKNFDAETWMKYNSEEGLLRLAKEAVCDIKGYSLLPDGNRNKIRLEKAFGADTVKRIEEGLNELEKEIDFRKITNDTASKDGGSPLFAKKNINNSTPPKPESTNPSVKNLTVDKQNKDINRLEKATDNLRNELVKKDEKIKAAEMNAKRTERAKLNKKLDTAKDKLAQTRYDNKEKIKATKEEGRERLHKFVAKKNQEKYEAVKETRKQSNEKITKLKAKSLEKITDAKQSARATTTDKKMKLAMTRLDNALNKAYDKPESKELDEALNAVKKFSRSSIKLINNVKNKLPSSYGSFADDVLDIIDTYYTGGNAMTPEKRASLEKKAQAIQDFAKEHPEYPLSKKALELLKEPSKKNIADLSPRDLVSLAEDLQEIGMAVRDMFSFARASEDAVKLRQEAIEFVKKRLKEGKGRQYTNLSKNPAKYIPKEFLEDYQDKRATILNMVLSLSGGDPHSPFMFIPERFLNGYDRYNRATEMMLKLFDKYVDVKKAGPVRLYNNLLNDMIDPKKTLDVGLKSTNGIKFTPTIADAISAVLGAKDPQFAGHTIGVLTDKFKDGKPVLSEGGLAVFSNNIDERFGRINKGMKRGVKVKLTAEDVVKLEKSLIEKYPILKDFMGTYKELTDLTYNLNNETNEDITGTSLEKRDYYIHIKTDPASRSIQNVSDKLKGYNGLNASDTLLNTSIVKPVVEGADGQILVYPINEVIGKLMSDTALYYGYATALYDINTFLAAETEDGEKLVELINHLDPNFLENYGKITNALVGNIKGSKLAPLGSNYTQSILNANFWLALKQAASLFTVMQYFDKPFRSLLGGIFKRGKMADVIKNFYKEQGVDISKLNNAQTLKYFWNEYVNSELEIRQRGYSTPDQKQILKHMGILNKLKGLDWYKSVDIATVNTIAWSMLYEFLNNPDLELGNDSAFRELSMKFLKAHTATQPNTSPITRAPIQLSGEPLDRALSFMADPRVKTRNALGTAKMENDWAKKNGTAEEKEYYRGKFAKAVVGVIASLVALTLTSKSKKKVEGKEDNSSFLEDLLGNAIGLTIGLEQIAGKFLNDYSFDVSLPDTQAFNMILNAGDNAGNVLDDISAGNEKKTEKDIKKVLEDLSGVSGIPYKNLKNAYTTLLRFGNPQEWYKQKIKQDSNMYKKYEEFEDDIYDYEEFYKLYNATREKAVEEEYGKYNNDNIKRAIRDNDGDLSTYFKMFKEN